MSRTPIRDKAWFIFKIGFSRNHAVSLLWEVLKAINFQACEISISSGIKIIHLPGQPRADRNWDLCGGRIVTIACTSCIHGFLGHVLSIPFVFLSWASGTHEPMRYWISIVIFDWSGFALLFKSYSWAGGSRNESKRRNVSGHGMARCSMQVLDTQMLLCGHAVAFPCEVLRNSIAFHNQCSLPDLV